MPFFSKRPRVFPFAAAAAVFLSLVVSLEAKEPTTPEVRPNGEGLMLNVPPASTDVKVLAEGNTRFALDLYSRLKTGEGNLFFSPYSISNALAMTSAGARSETLAEMTKTLHLSKEQAEVHRAFKGLNEQINVPGEGDSPRFILKSANALWGQEGDHFLPEFLKVTRDNYGAGLRQVDFKAHTEAARTTINDWIAGQTNDKIKDMIPSSALTPQTSLVLTNAIYFLGSWVEPFQEWATQVDAPFHTSSGRPSKVRLMAREGSYAYNENRDFQAVELPYAGGTLGMVVLLPRKADGLPALEALLDDPTFLKKTLEGLKAVPVKLEFPRFKLMESIELAPVLSKMGMPLPFDPLKADFSGMNTQRRLFISEVIHKAYVDVNEKGTEAAAATAAVMKAAAAMRKPVPPVSFKADHPSVFLIRERATGSLLFLGRLVDPGH